MQFHASLPLPLFGVCPVGEPATPKSGDFRNMFSDDEDMVLFAGYGPDNDAKTRKMLERLAVRITREGETKPRTDKPGIPAGYTYLAQMVGHDIVHSVPGTIDVTEARPLTRNRRLCQLVLDTIYGRGPAASPAAYEVPGEGGQQRTRLRLGKCRMDGARPAGGPALDIPRTQCPHLDNRLDRGATEALLADPRNDVSLLLSQLTVLFHLLHNGAESKLAMDDEKAGRNGVRQGEVRFAKARKAAAFVFRRIIENDLMPRLLSRACHKRLSGSMSTGHFLDDVEDERVPLEFSHAAYRLGHSMVRSTYAVNDGLPFAGVKDIVRFTSSRRPHEMPLSSDWLVQWSRFFELSDRAPNSSQAIRPAVAPALGVNDLFATQDDEYGGLILRDLLRGADAGQCSVGSLIEKLPDTEKSDPFLTDPVERAGRIEAWLRDGSSTADDDPGLSDEDIRIISADPPLLFFILLEAEEIGEDARLGPVGSMIVGETVYSALYRTRSMIEDDADTAEAVSVIFGSDQPGTMPDLINHLVSTGDLPGV